MQSSKGMIMLIRIIQVKLKIENKNYKDITSDLYLDCENIPILWKKNFIENCKE